MEAMESKESMESQQSMESRIPENPWKHGMHGSMDSEEAMDRFLVHGSSVHGPGRGCHDVEAKREGFCNVVGWFLCVFEFIFWVWP